MPDYKPINLSIGTHYLYFNENVNELLKLKVDEISEMNVITIDMKVSDYDVGSDGSIVVIDNEN